MTIDTLRRLLNTRTAALMAILTTLSGCGSTTDLSGIVSIDARNYETVSSKVVDAMQSVISVGTQGGTTSDGVTGVATTTAGTSLGLMDLSRDALQKVITASSQSAAPSAAGIIVTTTVACDSGNTTVIQTLDGSGTSYTLTFNDCKDASMNYTFTGSMTLNDVKTSGDLSVPATPGSLSATFDLNAVKASYRRGYTIVQGTFDYSITSADGVSFEQSINGSKLTLTQSADTMILSAFFFDVTQDSNTSAFSYTASGSLYSTAMGGSFTFSNNSPFTGVNLIAASPDHGVMHINGRSGSNVTMTASTFGYVILELDSNGDGKIDNTRRAQWDALR